MKLTIPSILKKRWFQFLLIIILVLGGYFYWQRQQKLKNDLETYEIDCKDLKQIVTASGKITAEKQVTLRFQTTGRLEWVGVKKGDRVKKWQAIASINQKELEKKLKQELLDYMNKRWDYDETMDVTYKDQVLTEAIRIAKEKAQFDLDRVVLDVEIADLAKKYSVLVTPISGVVTKATDEHPGINVSLLNTKYEITDPYSLRFTAEVEELDIDLIKNGLLATINLDAFPDKSLSSQAETIEFTAIETVGGSTAYNVQFPLPPNHNYRLGMNGNVNIIITKKNNVLAIPVEAVSATEDKKEVTVLTKDVKGTPPPRWFALDTSGKEKREIKTGLETDNYYEVIEGLEKGEVILLPE